MTTILGHAGNGMKERIGTVRLAWGQSVGHDGYPLSCFTLDFGNHTASIYHEDKTNAWILEIRSEGEQIRQLLFYSADTVASEGRALDEGTTDLVSWFLTDALG